MSEAAEEADPTNAAIPATRAAGRPREAVFSDPVTVLRGVGPRLAEILAAGAGIHTVADLLRFFPRRHEVVRVLDAPTDDALDELVRLPLRIERTRLQWLPGRRSMITVSATATATATVSATATAAGGGTVVQLRYFNQPYLKNTFPTGTTRSFEGTLDKRGAVYELKQPRVLPMGVVPDGSCRLRYRELAGVSEQRLTSLIDQALRAIDVDAWQGEDLPAGLARGLPPFGAAVRAMHQPASASEHEAARRRFAIEEAVDLFRRVERARRVRADAAGRAIGVSPAIRQRIAARLPFTLTGPQRAALDRILAALIGPAPMGMLLQGDVGSGKTAVAVATALAVLAAGHQVAFLAPTQLLAEQHHAVITSWLLGSAIPLHLLTSAMSDPERRTLLAALEVAGPSLVFGTHALLSESTTFHDLGLVIIDEQHRFGVAQRTALVRKGDHPHVLYLTATPIPRTLTLTMFGDLDITVLRGRPPGHRSVSAFHLPPASWPRIVRVIADHLRRGGQAYVVCPKVGADGSKGGAVRMFEELGRRFVCALVHGKMDVSVRQAAIESFRSGRSSVLVGTTVLEVGVDVGEATLIVVVGCDRFGLATLHQLRGRVGRGHRRGVCILTGEATTRVRAVCRTTDGFELAEEDLRLRGAGELLGQRQSGLADLRALDPVNDLDVLQSVRDHVRTEGAVHAKYQRR